MIQNSLKLSVDERTNVEFKTSLFFRAGIHEVSEDQIYVIVRTIAGFMNAEGGTLYIGVNDSGVACRSITEEYCYLNLYPPYSNNTYHSNEDSYRRFIIDWAGLLLGQFASTLIKIDIEKIGEVRIAKVIVKRSAMPVWFDQTDLIVRADGCTKRLKGNQITAFMMQIDKDEFAKKLDEGSKNFTAIVADIKKNQTTKMDSILVVYPSGEFIHNQRNVDTMVEVIEKAGIENVVNLNITGRKGKGATPYVPFISKTEYFDNPTKKAKTQRQVGDYYIFKKYNVGDMMSKINEISNLLGLQLHVEVY